MDFRDQYLALYKVCTELGLSFGQCENDAKAILATVAVKKRTRKQLKEKITMMEKMVRKCNMLTCQLVRNRKVVRWKPCTTAHSKRHGIKILK